MHRSTRWVIALIGCVGVIGVTACGSDRAGGAPSASVSIASTYWRLALNQHAVTLALTPPYDTIRLRPRALNPHGDTIALGGVVQYAPSDSSIVIDAQGLVTAHYETITRGTPAYIIASLQDTVQNVTHKDTVFFQVTPAVPASPLATLSIRPLVDGQTKASVSDVPQGTSLFAVTVADQQGNPMPDVIVSFTSSDSTVATIESRATSDINNSGGLVLGVHAGVVTFYATSWAYGVAKRDSFTFTFTIPNNVIVYTYSKTPYASLTPVPYFYPAAVTIGRGGVITWDNSSDEYASAIPMDVVFDDPTHVDSATAPYSSIYTGTGNFTGLYADQELLDNGDYDAYFAHIRKARSFPVPGTYRYHSAVYGTGGTIIVQ